MNQNVPVILVIEDDNALQVVVEDALSEGGFEAAIAASASARGDCCRSRRK